jgi:hypothetical protein
MPPGIGVAAGVAVGFGAAVGATVGLGVGAAVGPDKPGCVLDEDDIGVGSKTWLGIVALELDDPAPPHAVIKNAVKTARTALCRFLGRRIQRSYDAAS